MLGLVMSANPENVGDVYEAALDIAGSISDPISHHRAEQYISQIRGLARQADIGWKLFDKATAAARPLTDEEIIQVMTLASTWLTFCYGAERLDEASAVTGPDSTPVRFYINSLYHYIASLYLLEKDTDPIGGTVYKTLSPLGLAHFLDPIKTVLDEPMNGISFGETIRKIRNDFLVHGVFSPSDIAPVVGQTRLRDMTQVLRLADLIWELFNRSFVLRLRLISLLTDLGVDPAQVIARYLAMTG
ncbi:MAG TPA: hypothetical protein VIH26_07035 [Anaerolineales bacterium]